MATGDSSASQRQQPGDRAFGPLARPSAVLASGALWIALLLAFRLLDHLDLAVSGLFFDPVACAATLTANDRGCSGFALAAQPMVGAIRNFLQPLPAMLAVAALAMMLTERAIGRPWRYAGIRVKAVLALTMVLGPGLIVNGVLKAVWGRPRPWMTEDFGGWLPFVKAGTVSAYCDTGNCSFVSGEAASAGWLMCLSLLAAVHGYRTLSVVLAAVAIAMAGLRVAFGAHYLSDVVLGFVLTVVVFTTLAAWSEGNLDPAFRRMRSAVATAFARHRGK